MTYGKSPALIEIEIMPVFSEQRQALAASLSALAQNDPDAQVDTGHDENIILGGASESHIDNILQKLKQQGFEFAPGRPVVAYRETITKKMTIDHTHKRFAHGRGEYARLIMEIEPKERGSTNALIIATADGAIPNEFFPGIEKGVDSVLKNGPITGSPLTDVGVTVVDGAHHESDSSITAFEIAARAALREGVAKAAPLLLEPIMNAVITVPEDHVGAVIADLHSRRGRLVGTSPNGSTCVLAALVPLTSMFGYAASLNRLAKGQGTFVMTFSHYDAVSPPGPDDFTPAIGMRM